MLEELLYFEVYNYTVLQQRIKPNLIILKILILKFIFNLQLYA